MTKKKITWDEEFGFIKNWQLVFSGFPFDDDGDFVGINDSYFLDVIAALLESPTLFKRLFNRESHNTGCSVLICEIRGKWNRFS